MKTVSEKTPDDEREEGFTELQVLQSAAGYYIGRMHWNTSDGKDTFGSFWEPGSRETDYYTTRETAQKLLDSGEFSVKRSMENESAYDAGVIDDLRQKKDNEYN